MKSRNALDRQIAQEDSECKCKCTLQWAILPEVLPLCLQVWIPTEGARNIKILA
jgi:hypothetical protein